MDLDNVDFELMSNIPLVKQLRDEYRVDLPSDFNNTNYQFCINSKIQQLKNAPKTGNNYRPKRKQLIRKTAQSITSTRNFSYDHDGYSIKRKRKQIEEENGEEKLVKVSIPETIDVEQNGKQSHNAEKQQMKLTEEEVIDFFTEITKCPFCFEDVTQFKIEQVKSHVNKHFYQKYVPEPEQIMQDQNFFADLQSST